MTNDVPIGEAVRLIRGIGGSSARIPSYQKIWGKLTTGVIPGKQIDGRWYVNSADLPDIARGFGVKMPNSAAA